MINLHLVRHGIRFDAEDPSWIKNAARPKDTPLSQRGRKQAAEVGEFMRGKGITQISSSPYLRALETAEEISKNLSVSLNVQIEEGIREWVRYKQAEPIYIPFSEAAAKFELLNVDHNSIFKCPTSIETPEQIHQRCKDFIEHLTKNLINQQGPTLNPSVILVSHAATVIGLVRALLDDPTFNVKIATCSISTFQLNVNNDDPTWDMVSCNSTSHLSEGIQCAWGFKDS